MPRLRAGRKRQRAGAPRGRFREPCIVSVLGRRGQHAGAFPFMIATVRWTIGQRTGSIRKSAPAKQGRKSSRMTDAMNVAIEGPFSCSSAMAIRIGYARCPTLGQDLEAQRKALLEPGAAEDRIHTDHGSTGANRERPGLDRALAARREGDTLAVPKPDRLARSVPDARAIAKELERKGVKPALGATIHDPADPMGRMFFKSSPPSPSSRRTSSGCAPARAWRSPRQGESCGGRSRNRRKGSRGSSGGCTAPGNAR